MNPQRSAEPDPKPGPRLVPSPRPFSAPAAVPGIEVPAPRPGRVLQFPAPAGPAEKEKAAQPRARLLLEFIVLYIGAPVAVWLRLTGPLDPLAMLWLACAFCLTLLLLDPSFDRRQLWNAAPLRRQLPQILALFAAGVAMLTALVHAYAPHLLFGLARRDPRLLGLVLISYPVVSVLPQTLVYRVFLFHRYRPLLRMAHNRRSLVLIVMSAAAFSFSHIVFHNWIAPALTLPGGILFATRFHNTRSACVSGLEHTLYGCFLFTVGLGRFFGVF